MEDVEGHRESRYVPRANRQFLLSPWFTVALNRPPC